MLTKLVPDIQKTAELVAEINGASAEQSKGIQQVNTAIQQFNQVVQSNASASEELASTSEELSSQAEELKSRLAFFTVNSALTNRIESRRKPEKKHVLPAPVRQVQKKISHVKDGGLVTEVSAEVPEKPAAGVRLDMGDDDDQEFQRM
jgi:methyl-accepting chemotaxis protein